MGKYNRINSKEENGKIIIGTKKYDILEKFSVQFYFSKWGNTEIVDNLQEKWSVLTQRNERFYYIDNKRRN